MIDPALAAVLVPLILGTGAGLRWWIERRDAQRMAKAAEQTRELSEAVAGKTIRTLERQLRQSQRREQDLRREMHELLVAWADREEERQGAGERTR